MAQIAHKKIKLQDVYIVQVNGKVSSEAYATLQEAQAFITSRTDIHFIDNSMTTRDPFTQTDYEIHVVTVKEII